MKIDIRDENHGAARLFLQGVAKVAVDLEFHRVAAVGTFRPDRDGHVLIS